MNTWVLYPILVLFVISAFSQVVAFSAPPNLSYTNTIVVDPATGTQTLNGTESNLQQGGSNAIFDVNMVAGFTALIIALIVVGVLCGIKVLGSGLDTYSVQLIHKSTVYYGVWGIFSALSYVAISSFPLGFGIVIWFAMTIVYTMGFFQTLQSQAGA